MMIDRRLVKRLQAMKPGERLILPAKYSAEINVRNLLAAYCCCRRSIRMSET